MLISIKELQDPVDPCRPSPCGPNSECVVSHSNAVCTCRPSYIGSPPNCRPECVVSSECGQTLACVNMKCVDPCPGTCGFNARCQVINHNPICSCNAGYNGDPFVRCNLEQSKSILSTFPPFLVIYISFFFLFYGMVLHLSFFSWNALLEPHAPNLNPCVPSPCGPNSQCRVVGDTPVCSCLPNYVGRSPNCRPECTINSECPANLACINEKCGDPCPGSCGLYAQCTVTNHRPICICPIGYTGDPFSTCNEIRQSKIHYLKLRIMVSVYSL